MRHIILKPLKMTIRLAIWLELFTYVQICSTAALG